MAVQVAEEQQFALSVHVQDQALRVEDRRVQHYDGQVQDAYRATGSSTADSGRTQPTNTGNSRL